MAARTVQRGATRQQPGGGIRLVGACRDVQQTVAARPVSCAATAQGSIKALHCNLDAPVDKLQLPANFHWLHSLLHQSDSELAEVRSLMAAPPAASAFATARLPLTTASPRGVRPRLFCTCVLAQPSSSASTAGSCPALHDHNKLYRQFCTTPLLSSMLLVCRLQAAHRRGGICSFGGCSYLPSGKVQGRIVCGVEGIGPGPLAQQHAHAVGVATQCSQM